MLLLMLLRILLDYFDCLETFKFALYKSQLIECFINSIVG